MTLFLIPSIIALVVILAIYLNDINPWAGKPVHPLIKDAAFIIVILALLNLAFSSLVGGK